ncbi:MAG: hypothetical protein RPU32_00760 [Candidatus Sedimenticola sp. (ex Thyasira tokunagai)]
MESKDLPFRITYPALPDGSRPGGLFEIESDHSSIVHGCIEMMSELNLDWISASSDEWERTLYPGTLWLTHSGLLISRERSSFRRGMTESELLDDCSLMERTSFGWGFIGCDVTMDGMAHRYISYQLKPLIHKYFEHCEYFEYHLFSKEPKIPDWLNAEYLEDVPAIAVLGKRN